MKKRLISLLMVICLCVGLLPTTGIAVEDTSEADNLQRYTVLILDTSGSMGGTPAKVQKEAAIKFCESVTNAKGTNYVAIVKLNSSSTVGCQFTTDVDTLKTYINTIPASGGTNINRALEAAGGLLDNIDSDGSIIKNIVLCSDGIPQSGTMSNSGKYTSSDHSNYMYANVCVTTAEGLKTKGYNIYTLGFFHSLSGKDLTFGRQLMKDIASSESQYYEVTNVDDLEFTFGEIADEVTKSAYTFAFSGHIVEDDVTSQCFYTDDYFLKDSTEYDSSLATMSLCFELTTWSRYDEEAKWTTDVSVKNTKFKNAQDLLINELNFDDFAVNPYWGTSPTKDSIGVVAANKLLSDGSTLIAVGIRGGGYEQEWASNFTVGKDGNHNGFETARDETIEFLEDYINKNSITGKIKLWIVGYSRAGATANMVAGKLDDGYSLSKKITLDKEDLFAYTFEAPQGVIGSELSSNKYDNIHNVINLNDIVPLVAPSCWDFYRYNVDVWLPSAFTSSDFSSSMLKKMTEIYDEKFSNGNAYLIKENATQYKLKVDPSKILPGGDPLFSMEEYTLPTQTVLLNSTDFLFDGVIGSRDIYYYDFQAGVREIFSLLNGGSITDLADEDITVDEFVEKICGELTTDRIVQIVKPAFALNLDSVNTRKDKVKENVEQFVKDCLSDSDLWGTVTFAAGIGNSLSDLLWRLVETTVDDALTNNTSSLQSTVNLICSAINGEVGQAHYPEITLAWLMSMDDNYVGNASKCNTRGYRVIHINCPVDVRVYKGNSSELVAAIENNVVEDIPNQEQYAFINGDSEKLLYLPIEESYKIQITATDDGVVNYSVNEYSLDAKGNSRIINYYDIKVEMGDIITGIVPAFSDEEVNLNIENGSSTKYSLYDKNNMEISPTNELVGDEALNAEYEVIVKSNNEFGYVTGGGTYVVGNFAEVVATPVVGSKFIGWYADGRKVSDDENYRFAVKEETNLTAHFSEAKTYQLSVVAGNGGKVTNQTLKVSANAQIQLEAVADEGYIFKNWIAEDGSIEDSNSATTWFTMPERTVTVQAVFERNGNDSNVTVPTRPTDPGNNFCPKDSTCPISKFTDASATAWYHDGVHYVLENGLMAGQGDGKFAPNATLTRAELAQILYNKAGKPAVTGSSTFTDVPASAWYAKAIAWAQKNNVVSGIGGNKFAPNQAITREQIAVMLYNEAGKTAVTGTLNFKDAANVSDWAKDAMIWATQNKVINGATQSDGTLLLNAKNGATRAETAAMLANYYNK